MSEWLDALRSELRTGRVAVRVVVASARGSAPREAGACMVVGEGPAIMGTIGGGHLEWKAIGIARGMLALGAAGVVQFDRLSRFSLGATLGQCCGGVVELWFERFDAGDLGFIEAACEAARGGRAVLMRTVMSSAGKSDAGAGKPERKLCGIAPDHALAPRAMLERSSEGTTCLVERIDRAETPLWIFGAGHVGSALVKVLADLPLRITWVDSREEEFIARLPAGLPGNVTALASESPADEVHSAPAGAYFIVLTHSHDLDYEICRALLGKNDFAWAGLIGSKTKAAKFRHRLERQGVPRHQIDRLTCPIGVDGIHSKLPAAIALAVAAQVLQAIDAGKAVDATQARTTSQRVAAVATSIATRETRSPAA